jgi:hypothetical protein
MKTQNIKQFVLPALLWAAGGLWPQLASGQCLPPPSGLVAWWTGDGNALDFLGQNNGTLVNGATFAPGEVGQAFGFNGNGQSVVIPDSPSLRLTNSFTIEAWVNPATLADDPHGPGRGIVCKLDYATGGNYGYEFTLSQGYFGGSFNSPGHGWGTANWGVSVPTPLTVGVWSHVAWTYDENAMMLYVNGVPVATNVIGPQAMANSTAALQISGDGNGNIMFDGLIDEVALYNRAVSAAEIAATYIAGSAGKCKGPIITNQPQSQLGYWGKSVTFSIGVTGAGPISYQWFNGINPITGATNSVLVLNNLQTTNAGTYMVVVTGPSGSTPSSPATLTVNPAGVSIALYAGVTIDGVVGQTYGVQSTTDLSNPNSWAGQTNITLNVPEQIWYDSQPASQVQRYYRVVAGPISIP